MNLFLKTTGFLTIVMAFLLIWYGEAYAYIDPSATSYFLQLIIAGFLGAVCLIKVFWGNIKSFFSRKPSREREIDK